MKKLLTIMLCFPMIAFGQTFPVNNLQLNGAMTGNVTGTGNVVLGSNAAITTPTVSSPNLTGVPVAPTAAFATNSTQLATSAFVQAQGLRYPVGGWLQFSTNTAISAAQMNNNASFAAAGVTATLPSQASVLPGSTYTFEGGGFGGTIAIQGTDQICLSYNNCLGLGVSYTIGGGDVVTLSAQQGTTRWQVTSAGTLSGASDCISVGQFDADPTGVSDTTGPLNRAIAFATLYAATTHQGLCVSFPAGKFTFSSSYTYTFPNTAFSGITIRGAGQEATTLAFSTTGNGLTVSLASNANTVHLRDFTVTNGVANGTAAILITNPTPTITVTDQMNSDVTNVTVRGADGPGGATDYWNYGILATNVSNVNFTGISVQGVSAHNVGVGIQIGQNCSSCGYNPVQFNITGSQFSELNQGVVYGNAVQGVTINQSNFTNDNFGVYIATGLTGLDQLTVTNNQFNCFNAGVYMLTAVIQTMIANNLFLIRTSSNGVYFSQYINATVTGNMFGNAGAQTSTTGISFISNVSQTSVVTGNSFAQLTTGINLQTGSTNVNVQSNAYSSNTTNVLNNCSSGCTVGGGSQ